MQRFFSNLIRDLHLPQAPFWMVAGVIVLVVLTWVPLALVARARVTMSPRPRVHLFQDMDRQPRVNPQSYAPVFADHRGMRPPVPGTVARGELNEDEHLHQGYRVVDGEVEFFNTLPQAIAVDERLLLRGQDMYRVHCFPCHGLTGEGDGPTHHRAAMLMAAGAAETSWVQPTNLLLPAGEDPSVLQYGPDLYPDGQLYNVIVHGVRNMPAYGHQINVRDRWAIVAYLRALQLNQVEPAGETPAADTP